MSDAESAGRRGAVVVGASSGVGRALAGELAAQGYDLVVGARDRDDLEAVAADLSLRHGAAVTPLAVDLEGPDDDLELFVKACLSALPTVDAVLVPAGAIASDDDGSAAWSTATTLVTTNLLGVVKVAGTFASHLEAHGGGTLVLFSSIAAATPRGRNVVYGAAKAGLEHFGRGLQHRFAGGPVRVQVYALGYVDTAMTRGMRLALPVARPERIARRVVADLGRPVRVRHLPRWWGLVVRVLRLLPWPVYRRLRF
jgi:decaprenylphospho-beta-D-erythro-pentofuranosid-2-ulose 2-reductase